MVDILVPVLSAAGGGLTAGWFVKLLLQRELKRHDDVAKTVQDIVVQLTRVEVHVSSLRTDGEHSRQQGAELAALKEKVRALADDLEDMAHKFRNQEQHS